MFASRKVIAGGVAGAALVLSASAAFAYPAAATAPVNVRSGPGTSYTVIGALSPGEGVAVERCAAGWCLVADSGPSGWVSSAYLSTGEAPAVYAPTYVEPGYPAYADIPDTTYVPSPWSGYGARQHFTHHWQHAHVASGATHWSGIQTGGRRLADIGVGGNHHRRG